MEDWEREIQSIFGYYIGDKWISSDYEKRTIKTLESNAAASYAVGDISIHEDLAVRMNFSLINRDAMRYAQQYGKMLKTEGASIINGVRVPWLREKSIRERDAILKIIRDGIKNGTPTGVKQAANPPYPKGSIADKLSTYFDQRRSHAAIVARTETARINNMGRLTRAGSLGVRKVQVTDGGDPAWSCNCIDVDGTIQTVEWAMQNELDHPSCVRAFSPIFDPDELAEVTPG